MASVTENDGVFSVNILHSSRVPDPKNTFVANKADILAGENVYIVDSVKSGLGERSDDKGVYVELVKPLLDGVYGIQHTYIKTTGPLLIGDFAAGLKDAGARITVVLIGGDTSVGEFVNDLSSVGTGRVRLVVFPAGTGNALALSLGINDNLDAMRQLLGHRSDEVLPLHMYQVAFPPGSCRLYSDGTTKELRGPVLFLVVMSWAFHASLVADSDQDEMRKKGIERFKIAAMQNLQWKQEYNARISISSPGLTANEDAIVHDGPFAYLVITPARKFEPKFEVLPSGNILDDSLHVIGFDTEESPTYIMDIMNEVYDNGAHVHDKRVFYDEVQSDSRITLDLQDNKSARNRRFCVDGAIISLPNTHGQIVVHYYGSRKDHYELEIVGKLNR